MRLLSTLAAGAAAMLVLTGCTGTSAADDHKVGLAGETIELIVPFAPGGGYDSYARMLAPELAKELHATVIVVNKPGAGGVLATNELSKAEPDGTTLALFNMPGHIGSALAGAPGVQYDVNSFSYIGRLSSEPDVVLTSKKGKYDTWKDVMQEKGPEPTRFAATGPGSNEYMDGVVLHSLLGLKSKVITGYSTSNEAYLGVMSGVVDLHSRSYGSQESALKSGDAVPLLTIGSNKGLDLLADAPVLADVVPPQKEALARAHTELVESGRAIAGPPGMKPEQLELIRKAFEKVVTDPGYVAAAEEARRPISFASGEDVAENVEELMNSPQDYVDLLEKAYGA
ncbi:Bug family tripartite tricarboxylate transporter substrate binding protein [Streptomyces sp. NPDC059909]|uniref:Bug family tripartite tricarboxylate transporter substrate binding protein n=1 Tax=Streptomyces sp. NPDC059909 TaxID=3346998 RepID=UPI00365507CD